MRFETDNKGSEHLSPASKAIQNTKSEVMHMIA